MVVLLSGCATVIAPPILPAEPVEVFIIDHGRTSSLVIPASNGGMLRYAYGDWSYYALGKTGFRHGLAALLWPTRGALGRAQLEGAPTMQNVRTQNHSVQSIHALFVERTRVQKFERDMETFYRSRHDTEVENPVVRMRFVHHPRRYTYFWNSNHAVAAWLRTLGAATRGPSYFASWRFDRASLQAENGIPASPTTDGSTNEVPDPIADRVLGAPVAAPRSAGARR